MKAGEAGLVWICSAWEPEQRVLRSLWDESLLGVLEDTEKDAREACLRMAHPSDLPIPAFQLLGVGAFQALENMLTLLLETQAPQMVYFVATAGASPGAVSALGDVYEPTHVAWEDAATRRREAYLPEVMAAERVYELRRAAAPGSSSGLSADLLESGLSPGRGERFCLSTWAITRHAPDRGEKPYAENLELYSCARACARFGRPLKAYLGVSNWIGPAAHEEWKRLGLAAACRAQMAVYAALGGGSSSV